MVLVVSAAFAVGTASAALEVGNELQVLWDDQVVDTNLTTAARVLHHPEYAGDVLEHDRPWEGDGTDYHCIFRDGDVYRMYYNGLTTGLISNSQFRSEQVRVCYAESKDGISWTRPNLGLREFEGSKENNIVVDRSDNPGLDNFFVFKDPNPDCPKDELYKAVTCYSRLYVFGEKIPQGFRLRERDVTENGVKGKRLKLWGLALYTSPDPFHFKFSRGIRSEHEFDSLNTMLWDPRTKRYYCYCRAYERVKSERNGDTYMRCIYVTTSENGVDWTEAKPIDFGPDAEPYALYTNAMTPYFRNENIWVGFPTRYVQRRRWTKNYDRLPGVQERKARMAYSERTGLVTTDCIFMMTRDGTHFRREDEAFIRPGPETTRNWVYGDCYPAVGLVPTAGIDGSDDVLSIYHYAGHMMGGSTTLRRYTIRQDGFVSRQAPYGGARVVTKPLVFAGQELLINFSTSARGRLFVTVRDEAGRTLRSVELFGDRVDRPVDFETDGLASFAGKPVTLEFEMSDADLYSFRFN